MTISNGAIALIAGVGLLAYVGSQNSPAAVARRQALLQTRNRAPLYAAGANLVGSIANSIFGSGGSRGGMGPSYGGNSYNPQTYAPSGMNYGSYAAPVNYTPYGSSSYQSGTYSAAPQYSYA
jgi:hypothetical protein